MLRLKKVLQLLQISSAKMWKNQCFFLHNQNACLATCNNQCFTFQFHLSCLLLSCICFDIFYLLTGTGTIVRPKAHYTRPLHPPPDPPIPEACATGPSEPKASLFSTSDLEHPKQRHSYPERLVRSRSTDIVCAGRRPNSDPGINRRTTVEDQDQAILFATGSTTSPSKDSLKVEVCRTCYFNIILHAPGYCHINV